jgi:hypothetical protein
MLYAAFVAQFPEFANVPATLIQVHLDAAALELDKNVWGLPGTATPTPTVGTRYDQAHGYLAAHKLALSPYGMNVRLDPKTVDPKTGMTTYNVHFQALVRKFAQGFRNT